MTAARKRYPRLFAALALTGFLPVASVSAQQPYGIPPSDCVGTVRPNDREDVRVALHLPQNEEYAVTWAYGVRPETDAMSSDQTGRAADAVPHLIISGDYELSTGFLEGGIRGIRVHFRRDQTDDSGNKASSRFKTAKAAIVPNSGLAMDVEFPFEGNFQVGTDWAMLDPVEKPSNIHSYNRQAVAIRALETGGTEERIRVLIQGPTDSRTEHYRISDEREIARLVEQKAADFAMLAASGECKPFDPIVVLVPRSAPPSRHAEAMLPCFFTTAACETVGLADDCWELRTLRKFRDGPMQSMPGGSEDVATYYVEAPGIVRAISQRPDADTIWLSTYWFSILPAAIAARLGADKIARKIYSRTMEHMRKLAQG